MKQPIAGLVPAEVNEATIAVKWPGVAANPLGRLVGKMCGCYPPWDRYRLLGKLLACLAMPLGLVAYFLRLAPGAVRRYCLTNQRVVVKKGLAAKEERSLGLGDFDTIEIEVLPGYAFLHAGDLVFKRAAAEVLRLRAVPRPEPFRASCLKARAAMLAVRDLRRAGQSPATNQPETSAVPQAI